MRNYRFFFKNGDKTESGATLYKRTKDGKTHVAMLSDFFNSAGENLFCTNAMYADFLDAVLASIGICSTRDQIVLDLYENSESDEITRDMLQIGFRRYISACHQKLWQEFMNQIISVVLFAILGVFLIVFMRVSGIVVPDWASYCIDQFGTVLIWQMVGYFAFEYASKKRELNRLKQIGAMEYNFKVWE